MKRRNTVLAIVAVAALVNAGFADLFEFVETFDGYSHPSECPWMFGGYNAIPPDGGNPGAFLYGYGIDSVAPWLVGYPPGDPEDWVFTGNYREKQVTSISIDVNTIYADWPNLGNRPLTLMLFNDNGTPWDYSDDFAAIYRGPNIPFIDEGWLSYTYPVPSQATELPDGWDIWLYGYNAPPDASWEDVITNVTDIAFLFGDPELFYIFQMWELGADNIAITWIPEPASLLLLAIGAVTMRRR